MSYTRPPQDLLGRLAEIEPSCWERAPIRLAGGRTAEAFLGGPELRRWGVDVSVHGGWDAFVNR